MKEKTNNSIEYFRGESKKWKKPCFPSLFRHIDESNNKLLIENEYYKIAIEWLKNSKFIIDKNNKEDEIVKYIKSISLLQHYGFGTRLLDISSNFDIAMYFASVSNFSDDGYIYGFNDEINYTELKSIKTENVKRKFQCIKNIKEIENHDIVDYFVNKKNENKNTQKKSSIDTKTITSNIILKYENLFDTTIDNIRYERQSGAFIVTGNPLKNNRLIDEYNVIEHIEVETIPKANKIIRLFDLSNKNINHVYLFPDDDTSMNLMSINSYLINKNVSDDEKYKFFIEKFIKIYNIRKNEKDEKDNIVYSDYMSNNSKLYNSIINENNMFFFFKEFKDYITSICNNADVIIKENENLTIGQLIDKLVKEIKK